MEHFSKKKKKISVNPKFLVCGTEFLLLKNKTQYLKFSKHLWKFFWQKVPDTSSRS